LFFPLILAKRKLEEIVLERGQFRDINNQYKLQIDQLIELFNTTDVLVAVGQGKDEEVPRNRF
jgi:hypothetical protein